MFSYIAFAGAAYTAHKLFTSTASFIAAVRTMRTIPNIENQSNTIDDYEGLLKIGYIVIQDYVSITKLSKAQQNIREAKVSLCRESLKELERNIDTYYKAKEYYDSIWIKYYSFDENFHMHQMYKSSQLLRLRLNWLQ